jgi:hypothetical protein
MCIHDKLRTLIRNWSVTEMQKVNGKGCLLQEEEEEEEEATRTSNALFQAIETGIQDHFAGGLRYS